MKDYGAVLLLLWPAAGSAFGTCIIVIVLLDLVYYFFLPPLWSCANIQKKDSTERISGASSVEATTHEAHSRVIE
jgi:hypothetical protein